MKTNSLLTPLDRLGRQAAITSVLLLVPLGLAEERTATAAADKGRKAAERATERIEDYREAATEVNKAEVKAALAELDAQIAHLDSLATNAPDDASRQAAHARLDALKERRNDLKADFNQARFDELRADVRREWNEFKGWVRSKTDRSDPPRHDHPDTAEGSRQRADYVHAVEAGGAPVVAPDRNVRTAPAATSGSVRQEHTKAALARVDQELELLGDRAEKLDATAKEELQAKLDVLQDRREDLEKNFTEDRYVTLVRDIQVELDRARAAAE